MIGAVYLYGGRPSEEERRREETRWALKDANIRILEEHEDQQRLIGPYRFIIDLGGKCK